MIEYGIRRCDGTVDIVKDTKDHRQRLQAGEFEGDLFNTPVYRNVSEWKAQKLPSKFKRPRGVCSICGKVYSLTPSGKIFAHDKPRVKVKGEYGTWRYNGQCEGSRKPPEEEFSDQ